MNGRVAIAGCLTVVLLLSASPLGQAAPETSAALPAVPLPATGNVTVARLAIKSAGTSRPAGSPRLALASKRGLSASDFVVATVDRDALAGGFLATVAIVSPGAATARASQPARLVTLRMPPGFSLAAPPQIARNVLYANPTPSFTLAARGTGSVLAGTPPPKLPISRIVTDAQLLALDRSVPLVDMGLLGLQYVTAQLAKTSGRTLPVTIGLSGLNQVNAVELRFPTGIKVVKGNGPPDTDVLLIGNAVQLVASRGFYQQGLAYSFTLQLSRAPRKGEFVTLRASEHYFGSSLPFTERFALY